jgi:hypothetical protein
MPAGFREFLRGPNGRYATFAVLAVGLVAIVYSVWANLGPSDAAAAASGRWYVDAKTGKPFRHTVTIGDPVPCVAPSGGKTGFPAELCFWNKDGSIKGTGQEPTPVLLNSLVGKSEPTFCPECGRLVVSHNPAPNQGDKAPPTQDQYKARSNQNTN